MGAYAGPEIVNDGLVLCLDAANEKSYPGSGTTWTDISGNDNNGTLTNGPTYNSDNEGIFIFDGTNDYVSVNNLGLSDHTLEGWVKFDQSIAGTGGTDLQTVIGSYTATGGGKYTHIGPYGTNTVTYRIDDGVTSFQEIVSTSYAVGEWYNVALTYNSNGSCVAYLNGSAVGSISFTSNITFNNTPFDIARSQNGTVFDGSISTARVYNRALTADEVAQNFNALRGRYGI